MMLMFANHGYTTRWISGSGHAWLHHGVEQVSSLGHSQIQYTMGHDLLWLGMHSYNIQ